LRDAVGATAELVRVIASTPDGAHDDGAGGLLSSRSLQGSVSGPGDRVDLHIDPERSQPDCLSFETTFRPEQQRVAGPLVQLFCGEVERVDQVKDGSRP
jgi:hypothetical protein